MGNQALKELFQLKIHWGMSQLGVLATAAEKGYEASGNKVIIKNYFKVSTKTSRELSVDLIEPYVHVSSSTIRRMLLNSDRKFKE